MSNNERKQGGIVFKGRTEANPSRQLKTNESLLKIL